MVWCTYKIMYTKLWHVLTFLYMNINSDYFLKNMTNCNDINYDINLRLQLYLHDHIQDFIFYENLNFNCIVSLFYVIIYISLFSVFLSYVRTPCVPFSNVLWTLMQSCSYEWHMFLQCTDYRELKKHRSNTLRSRLIVGCTIILISRWETVDDEVTIARSSTLKWGPALSWWIKTCSQPSSIPTTRGHFSIMTGIIYRYV